MLKGFRLKNKLKHLLTRRASGSLSTQTNKGLVNTALQALPESPENILFHQKCDTLKYGAFIKIHLTGNLNHLIISGKPKEQDLVWAWQQIVEEYSELIKTEKSVSIFEAWKKIQHIQAKMVACARAIEFYREGFYDEEIANNFVEMGFELVPYSEDYDEFMESVDYFESESKSLIVFLNQAIAEYEKLCPKDAEGTLAKRTEMDYEKELAILRKKGYKINKKKNTVTEFAAAVNAFMDEQKILRQQNGKRATI